MLHSHRAGIAPAHGLYIKAVAACLLSAVMLSGSATLPAQRSTIKDIAANFCTTSARRAAPLSRSDYFDQLKKAASKIERM